MEKFWAGERVRGLLRRQHGRITWAQLRALDVPEASISQWAAQGRLVKVLPRVYAVGHATPNPGARLWEAILYAGPGAMLSHRSASHHRDLIRYPPAVIEVSAPWKRRSIQGVVRVYGQRTIPSTTHLGLPTTTIAQTVLDLAAVQPDLVRTALANLDYQRRLDLTALYAICGTGKRGTRALQYAIAHHQPALAYTNEGLEERFLNWCEAWKVPIPRFNAPLFGKEVDAYWAEYGLVVELDGGGNHSTPAQRKEDRRRDLLMRSHGLTVLRYDWDLLVLEPEAMHADLTAHMRTT